MKRDYLKQIGLTDEQINLVMDENGKDINSAKATLQAEVDKYKGESETNLASANDWKSKFDTQAAAYKDYDLLKKEHEERIAKEDKQRKVDWLKGQGCKHPELFTGHLDFTKASYDEEKKLYTGLDDDVKRLKTEYADMFESKGTQTIPPTVPPTNNPSGNLKSDYLKAHPEMARFYVEGKDKI